MLSLRYRNHTKNSTSATSTTTNIAGPSQGYFSCSDTSEFIIDTPFSYRLNSRKDILKNVEIQNQANHHYVNQHARKNNTIGNLFSDIHNQS
jgi:hypothetical protein